MLEIHSLTKRYDGFGAGKSTTVKVLIGLIEPSDGEIHFEGQVEARRVSQWSWARLLANGPRQEALIQFMLWFGAVALAALWLWMRSRRREGWGESKLLYEDLPTVVADLGLRG